MIDQETADGTDTSGVRLRPCNANEVLLSISEGGLKSSEDPKHPKAILPKVFSSFMYSRKLKKCYDNNVNCLKLPQS